LVIADIAEDVGCSTRQLQRVFQEFGPADFRSFLLQVRMEAAYRLLSRKKNAPAIRATARAVGYREASGLRQAFVRFYGRNPSTVRTETVDFDQLWRDEENERSESASNQREPPDWTRIQT
jgi:AraC-like DNA-binding protein